MITVVHSPLSLLLPLLLLALLIDLTDARAFTYNILNQSIGSEAPQNRLISQHFTDVDLEAYIKGADDILIPSNLAGPLNCSSLVITFVMVRVKHDENPQSVTVQFFYDDDDLAGGGGGKPGILFYSHQFYGMVWDNITQNRLFNMTFIFKNGDVSDYDGTVFNLSNTTLLPPNKRIWISFYATGPRDFSFAGFEENCLYWATYDNDRPNTWLYANNTTRNRPYHFIDLNNTMREGLQQWTPANIAEPLIGLNSLSLNLAWSVEFGCYDQTTESPTTRPTSTPTSTLAPTTTTTTPLAPTEEEIHNVTPVIPTEAHTINYTIFIDIDQKSMIIGILVPLSLMSLLCLCCCFCYRCYRRKKAEKERIYRFNFEKLNPAYTDEHYDNIFEGSKGKLIQSSSSENYNNNNNNNDDEVELDIFSESSSSSTTTKPGNKEHHY